MSTGSGWDVVYDEHGPSIEPHFCREWDGDVGCYGTNPDHGLSWEAAREEVVGWWKNKPEPELEWDTEGGETE